MTIFFCDIQGFKDICKGKDPTEVLELSWPQSLQSIFSSRRLEGVLQVVNEALEQNGGTLLEFIGDEACYN